MLRALVEGKDPAAGLASPEESTRMFRRTKSRTASDASSTFPRMRSRGRQNSSDNAGVGSAPATSVSDIQASLSSPILEEGPQGRQRRQPLTDITIGFFLHTPFPSSEIYRCVGPRRDRADCSASCLSAARSSSAFSTAT